MRTSGNARPAFTTAARVRSTSRLQIQEELVGQIGNYIMDTTRPRGLGVRISAVHMCKTHRGVRASDQSRMVNSIFYGDMLHNQDLKNEFLHEALAMERRALTG